MSVSEPENVQTVVTVDAEIAEREALLHLLGELGIEFELHRHKPAHTVDDLHECVAALMSSSVVPTKNLFVRSKKSLREVLIVLGSERKIELNKESIETFGLVKADNLRFATTELLAERLHAKQGALNAFCIRFAADKVELWVGKELLACEHWLLHPMINDESVKVKTSDMLKFFAAVCVTKVNAL
jgi:hypothetical protein